MVILQYVTHTPQICQIGGIKEISLQTVRLWNVPFKPDLGLAFCFFGKHLLWALVISEKREDSLLEKQEAKAMYKGFPRSLPPGLWQEDMFSICNEKINPEY
ncbi:Hypothetical predicted protein [Podarcis lilfordi]|uniref:Uncharacterized protein n=1 Tax=Podarcis lilfordi TaxID=74358 RepID=A0AA35KFY2_9SAUR|nr:Hypothetical predicted protein [Podarcis lilfordi]